MSPSSSVKLTNFLNRRPSREEALALANIEDWRPLAATAAELRNVGWGQQISYSRKVFVPLTQLCRDVCHYCTFAQPPRKLQSPYLTPDEVLEITRRGAEMGCKEVLFTLGDKPERRYATARQALADLGYSSTLEYLGHVAKLVRDESGLLPHLNPGLLNLQDFLHLRPVAASMGMMLESTASRLRQRGGPHFGSPDKLPEKRLECLRIAAQAKVPMTTGILVGIGENRLERIESLLAIRELSADEQIQEIIIQNFRAKPGTLMCSAAEPSMAELCWTIAVSRLIFGPDMSIQAPPNLYAGDLGDLISAGINDWGGVSPVTKDHVNPEAPWPHLESLQADTESAGFHLVERLTIYPQYIQNREHWIDPAMQPAVLRLSDTNGLARIGHWSPGAVHMASESELRELRTAAIHTPSPLVSLAAQARCGKRLTEAQIASLFSARGQDFERITTLADEQRAESVGDVVSYVINRNINYTNVCIHKCGFCAFSKGRAQQHLRGEPYLVNHAEIDRRVKEAWARGATEVCMQGGIHPSFTGQTYLDLCSTARQAAPDIHIHAFSPLEIAHGAETLGISVSEFLQALKQAGLNSLPGTAAEILDDSIRQKLAPGKMSSADWLDIVGAAHHLGLPTTATMMFGHIENTAHWARHLLQLKGQQQRSGGFTEFVPLPFVHMEAPIYLRGRARPGPTLREALLMHAVARLVLAPEINNIQVSWCKMGPDWTKHCLNAGVNDLGGSLMNESISRAAGAVHGQEFPPAQMASMIHEMGRVPKQRNTLYGSADPASQRRAMNTDRLIPPVNTSLRPNKAAAMVACP